MMSNYHKLFITFSQVQKFPERTGKTILFQVECMPGRRYAVFQNSLHYEANIQLRKYKALKYYLQKIQDLSSLKIRHEISLSKRDTTKSIFIQISLYNAGTKTSQTLLCRNLWTCSEKKWEMYLKNLLSSATTESGIIID